MCGLEFHLLEEEVQLGVRVGVDSDLEQRREDVVKQLLKVVHQALRLVDVVQPRNLWDLMHVFSAPPPSPLFTPTSAQLLLLGNCILTDVTG